ncbi:thiamine pyrophosphate-binding protein [Ancylobacter sp. Lp-2]|uniref:thiamine pyrophosphate-binding protein n=1 Tax=Ancylobacter sp. Lp-2 TaxID=2881339 RepID=UPI001E5FFE27|nr:thiamine pyrophosphate-binding protein [Ancylobacter sp. Lp-2]MCB4770410.1 thiamine pyrophosphate-binding protein [Ancylobacter sp. Lp-2]
MRNDVPGYELLARAYYAEGVRAHFTLMGDGNMHWAIALSEREGVQTIHARHEHCACGMAIGYAIATGEVGVASVTLGPGFTQTMTALTTAARAHVPMVLFTGEMPVNPENAKWYNQGLDQAPLALATGAEYISARSLGRLLPSVREAFYKARTERKPVVLGIPFDLQKQRVQVEAYRPSTDFLPRLHPLPPAAAAVGEVVERIRSSRHPIIIAGRGVVSSDAGDAVRALAQRSGALLSTTLPARGLFDDDPFNLGIAGGFSGPAAREEFGRADLVIAIGASLTSYTADGGSLFPDAFVVQIDANPVGLKDGVASADLYVRSDAREAAEAICAQLDRDGDAADDEPRARTGDVVSRIQEYSTHRDAYPEVAGTVDPRDFISELDDVLPKDWDIVSGTGHCAYFHSQMKNRRPENYHVIREFGAIGNGLSIAIGVAVAKGTDRVILIEGDGSLIMHIQELETIKRQGIKLLICVLNDGAYGAEIHKLRAEGIDESSAVFGRTDFASIAEGFGLRGRTVTSAGELAELFASYENQDQAEVWNVHISDQVLAPIMKRLVSRGLR